MPSEPTAVKTFFYFDNFSGLKRLLLIPGLVYCQNAFH